MLEEYVIRLLEELHLPAPSQEDGIIFSLEISDQWKLSLKSLHPGILITATICPIPQGGKENLFSHLLQANFLGQGTGGGSIGVDSTERFLTFSKRLYQDVNYQGFKEVVEDFVNYLQYWQREVATFQKEGIL